MSGKLFDFHIRLSVQQLPLTSMGSDGAQTQDRPSIDLPDFRAITLALRHSLESAKHQERRKSRRPTDETERWFSYRLDAALNANGLNGSA